MFLNSPVSTVAGWTSTTSSRAPRGSAPWSVPRGMLSPPWPLFPALAYLPPQFLGIFKLYSFSGNFYPERQTNHFERTAINLLPALETRDVLLLTL